RPMTELKRVAVWCWRSMVNAVARWSIRSFKWYGVGTTALIANGANSVVVHRSGRAANTITEQDGRRARTARRKTRLSTGATESSSTIATYDGDLSLSKASGRVHAESTENRVLIVICRVPTTPRSVPTMSN